MSDKDWVIKYNSEDVRFALIEFGYLTETKDERVKREYEEGKISKKEAFLELL